MSVRGTVSTMARFAIVVGIILQSCETVASSLQQPEESANAEPDSVPIPVQIEPEGMDPQLFFGPAEDSETYRVGPEDVLEIQVFSLDRLDRTVRVSGDGSINLPLVGAIHVANLTPEEVAEAIADKLRDRYVNDPEVSVFIAEFNSRNVSVLGAVSSPAPYPLLGRRNLLQVLAQAGGLAGEAGTVLFVFRPTEGGSSARLTVPLNELLVRGDPRWNIWILPGDVISVPPQDAISVSVLGAVGAPGVYKLPVGEGSTLVAAIAKAGGLSDGASKRGIQIKRRDRSGREAVFRANLGDILSGKRSDVPLVEGDVVVVNESFF